MKRAEHREQRLDDLLTTVRQEGAFRPLLSRNELLAQLEHVDAQPLPSHESTATEHQQNRTLRQIFIMGTFITVLLVGTSLLMWGPNREKESRVSPLPTDVRESSQNNGGVKGKEEAPNSTPTPDSRGDKATGGYFLPRGTRGKEPRGKSPVPQKAEESFLPADFPVVLIDGMTPQELQKSFGIRLESGKVLIPYSRQVDQEDLDPAQKLMLANVGINSLKRYIHQDYVVTLGDEPDVRSVNPTAATKDRGTALIGITLVSNEWNSIGVMLGETEDLQAIGRTSEEISNDLSSFVDTHGRIPSTSSLNQLMAIHLPVSVNGEEQHLYIWYIPTTDVIASLPDRLVTPEKAARFTTILSQPASPAYIQQLQGIVTSTPKLYPGSYTIQRTGRSGGRDNSGRKEMNVEGLRYIELTLEEAAKLGLHRTDSGIGVTMIERTYPSTSNNPGLEYYGYAKSDTGAFVGFDVSINEVGTSWNPIHAGNLVLPEIYPVIQTSRWFYRETQTDFLSLLAGRNSPAIQELDRSWDSLYTQVRNLNDLKTNLEEKANLELLNALVPVHVIYTSGGGDTVSVVLWYVPTRQFVNALPQRYADDLRKEIDAIAEVASQGLPSSEICTRVAGERTYLDLCRMGSGALIATGIYPNPARSDQSVTLTLQLQQERSVTVALHDLSGKFIREITPSQPLSAGRNEIQLSLKNVEAGPYLISIRTDREETAVQRVIVGS